MVEKDDKAHALPQPPHFSKARNGFDLAARAAQRGASTRLHGVRTAPHSIALAPFRSRMRQTAPHAECQNGSVDGSWRVRGVVGFEYAAQSGQKRRSVKTK